MNKKYLFSLSAMLSAALCLPVMTPSASPVIFAQQAIASADDFIETYCGVRTETASSQGILVRQFVWYKSATADNASLLVQSKAVFDTLPVSMQQQILAAGQAQGVNYLNLVESARTLLAPAAEEDVPVINPSSPAAQAPAQAPQPAQPADEVQPSANASVDETPAAAPAADAASKPSAPEPEKEAEAENKPEDSSPTDSTSEADADAADPDDADAADEEENPESETGSEASNTVNEPAGIQAPVIEDIQSQLYKEATPDEASIYVLANRIQNGAPMEAPVAELVLNPETETTNSPAENSADASKSDDEADIDTEPAPAAPDTDKSDAKPEQLPSITPGAPTTHPSDQVADTMDPAITPLEGKTPAGLTFEDHTDAFDANTEQAIYALAAKAGYSAFEVHPVTYIYQDKEVSAKTSGLIKLSGNGQEILFSLSEMTDQGANIQFYSQDSCQVDEAGNLQLQPGGQMFVTFTSQSEDSPADPADPADKSDTETPNQDLQDQTSQDKTDSKDDVKEADASSQDSQADADREEKPAQTAAPSINEDQALARSLDQDVANETGQTSIADADAFIDQYLYSGGQLITSATDANYKTLLGGGHSWNALDQASRSAVNAYLAANGSARFQTLYRQANEVRLGMSTNTGTTTANTTGNGVQTSTQTQWTGYLSAAVLSGGVLAWCAMEEKRKKK